VEESIVEKKRKYNEPVLIGYGSLIEQTQGLGEDRWDFNDTTCDAGEDHATFDKCMSFGST
jgi:hypothetical protein